MQRSNKEIERFYQSKEWDRIRKAYRLSVYGLCERCGQPGYIVHHKERLNMNNIYDCDITLSFENLELLCLKCHNKEHFEKNDFNVDGELINNDNDIFQLAGVYKK